VGQPAAGAGDRLAHGGEGQAQPVGVTEPVDHQLPVVQAGAAGDRPAGVVAAVGDVELMGDQLVHPAVRAVGAAGAAIGGRAVIPVIGGAWLMRSRAANGRWRGSSASAVSG
jgi:hypothetical protein